MARPRPLLGGGQHSPERESWWVGSADVVAVLFALASKQLSLPHPHSPTQPPGPALPPCFRGPL